MTNDSPASAASAAATTATYKLWQKATRLPFGSRLFTAAVSLKAPYFRTALPHVTEMRPGRCVVRGPGWWGNRNHIGTFHVIAACNLAEFAMGMLAEATVPATHRWIPVGMNVRYPAKSTGGMTVTAEWEQIPDFESITSGGTSSAATVDDAAWARDRQHHHPSRPRRSADRRSLTTHRPCRTAAPAVVVGRQPSSQSSARSSSQPSAR